ncbi:hypothetical protein CDCA_CDCA01G0313 [Cyanidium caldarium]|uniref:SsrA-binding protein n=1 Tax=Cyanidium caldarium TaxID=2771 RepID=A0AAV9IQR4_CYACA|nr:hypothetical protein CDCA_CDCA01G0313 [Cyanidium caldarium]
MPPSRRERVSATLPCFLVPFIAWRRSANLLSPVTETGRRWPQPPPPLLPRLARPLARPTGALRLEAAAAGKRKDQTVTLTFENRKAHFSYDILSTLECGIELVGTEVKSVRAGRLNLRDAYARVDKHRMELMLHNAHISIHETTAKYFNHDPTRVRRLLAHKAEIRRLMYQQEKGGMTLVPLRCYFNKRGVLKTLIGVARGKKLHDKRESIKKRETQRELASLTKRNLSDL